ncbi:phosphatase inhibitor-domain-containing protein [Protomyces lactucae-debilis]|uniref:Phosphatase inhibitor-domain-containing protein n=1 Tax=Protomyces lactucae-debilis TaxID=2754530 RepID=A0A1Y2FNK1_PROLT|nr:phosphatase inhibitor-domain-containing protein [Protomyces lactucae-debilis]ORY84295.1 phosphatase inhibitor-domain-containing protein [Protomyces lactucae-debilis]
MQRSWLYPARAASSHIGAIRAYAYTPKPHHELKGIRPEPVFPVESDPAVFRRSLDKILPKESTSLLTDAVALQIFTHKSFMHGQVPYNSKLGFMGRRALNLALLLHLASQASSSPLAIAGKQVNALYAPTIGYLMDTRSLSYAAQALGFEPHLMRWKPRRAEDLAGSGLPSVQKHALLAAIGWLELGVGSAQARQFCEDKVVPELIQSTEKQKAMARESAHATGTSASQIITELPLSDPNSTRTSRAPSPGTLPATGTLRLRGEHRRSRRVQWAQQTVDNEGLGRKSSKICCIYHRPRHFDSSSSSSSSSSGSSSDGSDVGNTSGDDELGEEARAARKALRERQQARREARLTHKKRKADARKEKREHTHDGPCRHDEDQAQGDKKDKDAEDADDEEEKDASTEATRETATSQSTESKRPAKPNAYEEGPR